MTLSVIILAAGQGTRMRAALPKVLHPVGGIPMLVRVIQTALALNPKALYVVCGHGSAEIRKQCAAYPVIFVEQIEQRGTGHAVQQVLHYLNKSSEKVLILYGDTPLIQTATLSAFISHTPENTVGLLTATLDNPTGLGRIIRDKHFHIKNIIEEKDASPAERRIKEINTGIYLFPASYLHQRLLQLSPHNAQKELYLTDMIQFAVKDNVKIVDTSVAETAEIRGVNDKRELAMMERYYQKRLAEEFLLAGVNIIDPARFDVRGKADIAPEVSIDINVLLEGDVYIDTGSRIEANCVLRNVRIGKNVVIKANCVIEDAVISDNCSIGPFARIRPETVLKESVSVGNFVEIKKSVIQQFSKISHLSYIGDADLGEKVNIGAGVITCNYDGVKKSRTMIGDNVFIGSNSQLIAPVSIGKGAYIGAGSTISKDAPAHKLTIARAKQHTVEHWQPPGKAKKEE